MAAPPVDSAIAFDPGAAEVRGLGLGLRAAWRLRLRAGELEPFRQATRQHGLALAQSHQPWTAQVGGQLAPRPEASGQVAYLAVVARDVATAQRCLDWETELHQLDGRGDFRSAVARMVGVHRQIGAAYGYPSCCVEAFCDAFVEVVTTDRAGDNPVAVARAAWRSLRFDPLLDTLTVELGERNVTPLRHLPCRFDCPASLELAGRLLAGTQRPVMQPKTVVVLATGEVVVIAGPGAVCERGQWRLPAGFVRVHGTTGLADELRSVVGRGLARVSVAPGVGLTLVGRNGKTKLVGPGSGVAANLLPAVLSFGASETEQSPSPPSPAH